MNQRRIKKMMLKKLTRKIKKAMMKKAMMPMKIAERNKRKRMMKMTRITKYIMKKVNKSKANETRCIFYNY
jgi:hypothetical protein